MQEIPTKQEVGFLGALWHMHDFSELLPIWVCYGLTWHHIAICLLHRQLYGEKLVGWDKDNLIEQKRNG